MRTTTTCGASRSGIRCAAPPPNCKYGTPAKDAHIGCGDRVCDVLPCNSLLPVVGPEQQVHDLLQQDRHVREICCTLHVPECHHDKPDKKLNNNNNSNYNYYNLPSLCWYTAARNRVFANICEYPLGLTNTITNTPRYYSRQV
jgi:hypothetical protein